MTKDDFLIEARRLKTHADQAEREFLLFLIKGESMNFWKEFSSSFVDFLEESSLINPHRYERFVAMRMEHGAIVDRVGVSAVLHAARLPTKAAQREVLDVAQRWEKTNGVVISERRASAVADEVRSRTSKEPRNIKPPGFKTYGTLAAELEAAMKQNAALKEENRNLRAELAMLKARLSASNRQPARSRA